MFGLVLLAFLLIPVVEFAVIVEVASRIGTLETIAVLLVVSIAGAWLVRREGMGVLRRIQAQLGRGSVPDKELVDGGLILFAGGLMLTPGFLTDIVGLLLLFPPTRLVARSALLRRFSSRVRIMTPTGVRRPSRDRGGVVDVDSVDLRRDDGPPERTLP